jgi:hypothetical protein
LATGQGREANGPQSNGHRAANGTYGEEGVAPPKMKARPLNGASTPSKDKKRDGEAEDDDRVVDVTPGEVGGSGKKGKKRRAPKDLDV